MEDMESSRVAVKRIVPEQTSFSKRIVKAFGRAKLKSLISELQRLSAVIEETSPKSAH